MQRVGLLLIFLYYYFTLSKCEIPTLSVRKVDSKIVEKKRRDTYEMCRLFNEENNLESKVFAGENRVRTNGNTRRSKRDIGSTFNSNPILNGKDIVRIEGIVEKMYDDLNDNGEEVTYRKRNLDRIQKKKGTKKNRRFNFAPAMLVGPGESEIDGDNDDKKTTPDSRKTIPWIKKWKYGIIPYFIDPKTYDSYLASEIIKAFDYIEKATCIRLQRLREKPLDTKSMKDVEWLYISNPLGIKQCVHSNERLPNAGVQMVVLGYTCLSLGEIMHEIMHVLGFSHEHTRQDRDSHISVRWQNIKPGYKKYFSLRHMDILSSLPYDYASVLHYPPRAFSRNGQLTISVPNGEKIGQREGLSEIDVEKIATIFGVECVERNKDYLLKTCSVVVQNKDNNEKATKDEINQYFENKIWKYGIVNYKIRDIMEFSVEERENIKAVIDHIEKETCIEFRDISENKDDNDNDDNKNNTNDKNNANDNDDTNDNNNINDDSIDDHNDNTYGKNNTIDNKNTIDNNNTNDNDNTYDKNNTTDTPNNVIEEDEEDQMSVMNETKSMENATVINIYRRHMDPIIKFTATADTAKEKKDIIVKESDKTKPKRRHAANVLVLTRSTAPLCKCPRTGRPTRNNILEINDGCFNSVNDLLHLFVHVLGLEHQHNMHDRDSYLKILWQELTPELKKEMEQKLPPAASAGFAYDYQSVMHYPWLQIKDGVTSIMYPIWNDGWAMGHWQGLSATDVLKINRIYQGECNKREKHNDASIED